jgi:hypothetical protein
VSLQWWDATRPDIGYQGMMPGRSDITEGESSLLSEAGFSIGAMRETLERTEAEVHNQGAVLVDYGEALERKVEPWAVPTVAPLSSTINRRADPTFQLSDFMVPLVRGTSDAAGHNHQHTTTSSAYQLNRGAGTKNRLYVAFITPAINRAYEQLNFMVSEVTTPCQLDVAVYVVAEDRSMSRQVLAVNAGAGLALTEALVTVTFPRWVATQGSYVAVAWLQHGSGNPRMILGLDDTPRPLTNVVFPRKISAIHTSTTVASLPASIDGTTQLDFTGYWFTPYAELSEDIGSEIRSFHDGFDKTGFLPRPWVAMTPDWPVYAQNGTAGVHGFNAFLNGPRIALYDQPLATDRVSIRAYAKANSSSSFSFVAVRTTNNMGTGVGVFYSGTTIQIRSWTGLDPNSLYSSSTVRVSAPFSLSSDRAFSAEWIDGVLTVYDAGGTQLLTWTDTVTQEVAAHRFVGIGTQAASNYAGPLLDAWYARDVPAEVEPEV